MKFKLFSLGMPYALLMTSVLSADALIPACNNILIPPKFRECLRETEDCLKCANDASREIQGCLCFGQNPASYKCYMDGLMPITLNVYYIDPKTHERIDGAQGGGCLNKDKAVCTSWQYFRGFCKNWVPIDVTNNQATVSADFYCQALQGRVDGEKCVDLPTQGGLKECDLIDLAKGNCHFAW